MIATEFVVVDEVRYPATGEEGVAPRPVFYLVGHFTPGQEVYLDDFDVTVVVEDFDASARAVAVRLDDAEAWA